MLKMFLASYWAHVHQQMPILHRPTFNPETCPDLLMVAMMCLGASCLEYTPDGNQTAKCAELSSFLAYHVRWEVFKDVEFRPTAKLWRGMWHPSRAGAHPRQRRGGAVGRPACRAALSRSTHDVEHDPAQLVPRQAPNFGLGRNGRWRRGRLGGTDERLRRSGGTVEVLVHTFLSRRRRSRRRPASLWT